MKFFKASLLTRNQLPDITTDGVDISIIDHSNYVCYTDRAVSATGTTLVLSSYTASSIDDYYNNMEVAIIDGKGVGQRRMITDFDGATRTITVATWSTTPDATSIYEIAEGGHLQQDFSLCKKIAIINPDDTDYLFSTLSDGDAVLTAPANVAQIPITTKYRYSTGDGLYQIAMYVLPTWNTDSLYLKLNFPMVYNAADGNLYQAITDTQAEQPDLNPSSWKQILTFDELLPKYRVCVNFVNDYDTKKCYTAKLNTALGKINNCCVTDLCSIPSYNEAMELLLIIEAIPGFVSNSDWYKLRNIINMAKQICSCNQ